MKYFFFVGLCLLMNASIYAQSILKGRVYDTSGKAIAGANITLSEKSSAAISAFGLSNSLGDFTLSSNSTADSLQLKVSYIGYASFSNKIANHSQAMEVKLQATEVLLKTVTVKKVPIYLRKDTLNYDVNSFSNTQDRTISDVLKKLPGVEVESSGRILYQGNPIQKLDINGMNLLDGKYALATNNLPANAVRRVQVMENDQPLKMLKGIIPSNRASINLEMKKFTTTGFAKIGAGFSPLLWDVNVSPISIFKTVQMLNTYQTNNIGNDVSRDLKNLTVGSSGISIDFGNDFIDFENNNNAFLSVLSPATPPFSQQYWLDNQIHLLSNHFLKKTSKGTEIKGHLSYVNDQQQMQGSTVSIFNTPTNVIKLSENQNNRTALNDFRAGLEIKQNKDESFLENKLSMQKYDHSNLGLLNNTTPISQQLNSEYFQINNQLKLIKKIHGQVYTLLSQLAISNAPQSLTVKPGVYADVLNDSIAYTAAQQQLQLRKWYANNALGFIKTIKRISLVNKIGWVLQKDDLFSTIALEHETEPHSPTGAKDFSNRVSFFQSDIYVSSSAIWKKDRVQLTLTLPVYYSYFDISNQHRQAFTKWNARPNINFKYDINSYFTLFVNSYKSNTFGRIHQLYDAYILTNYRTLQKQNSSLPEGLQWNNSVYVTYKNPLTNTFANVSLSGDWGKQNLISKYSVAPNGAFDIESIRIDNPQKNALMNGEIGKYFMSIKTTLKLGAGLQMSKQKTWIGDNISDISSKRYFYKMNVNTSIGNFLLFEYKNQFTTTFSILGNAQLPQLKYQSHQAGITGIFSKNQSLMLQGDYFTNNLNTANTQILLNAQYRYTLLKYKIDVEFRLNNVLDTRQFTSIYNDTFTNIQNDFLLRPRQFLISIRKGF